MEPAVESLLSYDDIIEVITEGYRSVKPDPEQEEEFFGFIEEVKHDEMQIAGQFETVDIKPVILSEKYQVADLKLQPTNDTFSASLCRLCATQGNDMIHVFEESELHKDIIEKIEHCLAIMVRKNDILPKQACQLCLEKLELCYQFHKAVAEAERQLRIIFDDRASGEINDIEEYCRTSRLCNGQGGTAKSTCSEKKLKKSSKRNVNSGETTTVSEELQEIDTIVENHVILPDLYVHSSELHPTITYHTTVPDEDSRMCSSNDEHENVEALVDPLNCDVALASEIGDDAGYCAPNSPTHTVNLEKESESEFHPPPITRSHKTSDSTDSEEEVANQYFAGQSGGCEVICRICGLGLPNAEKCHIHALHHTLPNSFPCSFCLEIFTSETEWKEHSLKHVSCKKFKRKIVSQTSNYSGKNLVTKLKLNFNKLYHKSSADPRYCKKCDKVMESETYLRWHMLTVHTEFKDLCCKICKAQFRTKEHLDAHQGTHRKPPPIKKSFTCDYCGKIYMRKGDLSIHIRNHTGYRPYKCDYCKKSFTRTGNRNYHRRTHTRSFECSICKRTFPTAFRLKSHLSVHSGETQYECNLCGIHFKVRSSMFRHMRLKHGNIGDKK